VHRNALGINGQFIVLIVVGDTFAQFADACSISIAMTAVALISCAVLCRRARGAIGKEPVDHGDERALLLDRIGDEVGGAERHHGAVIRRMIEAILPAPGCRDARR
jgi:hypothetical protein